MWLRLESKRDRQMKPTEDPPVAAKNFESREGQDRPARNSQCKASPMSTLCHWYVSCRISYGLLTAAQIAPHQFLGRPPITHAEQSRISETLGSTGRVCSLLRSRFEGCFKAALLSPTGQKTTPRKQLCFKANTLKQLYVRSKRFKTRPIHRMLLSLATSCRYKPLI